MNTEMHNLYSNFKKRVYSFSSSSSSSWSLSSPSSSSSSSPYDASCDVDTHPPGGDSIQMLYLISNMMSVFEDKNDNHDDHTLIYWPQKLDESSIRTCIIDRQFERTNTQNVFHIVDSRILTKNLETTSSSSSSSPVMVFTQCSCSNHRQDMIFDWNEFIPGDFVKTLYHYFLNHPHYSTPLTSLSPTYSIKLEEPTPVIESLPQLDSILNKYLSHDRIRNTVNSSSSSSIIIKPLVLHNDINEEEFNTIKV